MFRQKGDVLTVLRSLIHHVSPGKVGMLMYLEDIEKALAYRFRLIAEEAAGVQNQVEAIQRVATEKGYQDILDLLAEKSIEYGHKYPVAKKEGVGDEKTA